MKAIHLALFGGLYDFAGEVCRVNISKGDFCFVSSLCLEVILPVIDQMSKGSFEEMITKYVEMNVAHLFLEGNGRATCIWLNQIPKKCLGLVVD